MEYTAQLPNTRKMMAPVVALVIGAAGAVGTYALIDDSGESVQPTQVIVTKTPIGNTNEGIQPTRGIVTEPPPPPSTGGIQPTRGIVTEPPPPPSTGVAAKDEAGSRDEQPRRDPLAEKALMRR